MASMTQFATAIVQVATLPVRDRAWLLPSPVRKNNLH